MKKIILISFFLFLITSCSYSKDTNSTLLTGSTTWVQTGSQSSVVPMRNTENPFFELYVTKKADALAQCENDIKQGGMVTCTDSSHLDGVKKFWDNFSSVGIEYTNTGVFDPIQTRLGSIQYLKNEYGVLYVHASSYTIRSVKKIDENKYFILSNNPMWEDKKNVEISYLEYSAPDTMFVIQSDYSRFVDSQEDFPVPDKYYDTLAQEFQAGKFSDKTMDEWYQATLSEAKNIKETAKNNRLTQ